MSIKSSIISYFKSKNFILLIVLAIVLNHLTHPEFFTSNGEYTFPLYGVVTSLILMALIHLIIEFTFTYFQKNVFKELIDTKSIVRYIFTTLGIVGVFYIPVFMIAAWYNGDDFEIYALLIGLLITLIICIPFIAISKGKTIYDLHKKVSLDEKVIIDKGSKSIVIPTKDIAYFYSDQKIVYAVQTNGTTNITPFTLNEIEEKSSALILFRANRQYILHPNSIKGYHPIENGKLKVSLSNIRNGDSDLNIIVSRYKKSDFLQWFKNTTRNEATIQV